MCDLTDQLPNQVSELIERFARNEASYTSAQYNETQLRQEFINPFFEALGWDVRNVNGNAEAYKDVIHEDAIKIGSAVKAPDYSFRIGGTRKFFVEAKKPSVEISDNEDAAFQLRRYAWSANLSLSILTNFKEFAVYDCRLRPAKNDKASFARISYFSYKDYPQQWAYLVSIISKDSILKGSFDRYAESSKLKKGTAKVDDAFLEEIELWRNELAHKIAIRNTKINTRELNFAVQRTIDRIIFLRICEDRGVEQYGKLQSLMNGVNVYKRLYELFQRADERYNSGLFHFRQEKERAEEPDDLTPFLSIDDQPIKDIINRLYYPESPYEFSVLPADILGQVYEQFLGKVIRLTEGHHAKIEEKPEVRKAGGIYYTPTYIVDYIVKNTVSRLLGQSYELPPDKGDKGGVSPSLDAGTRLEVGSGDRGVSSNPSSPAVIPSKEGIQSSDSPLSRGAGGVSPSSTEGRVKKPITPKDVSKLRILDPACGSGSFLLGAYQYLLDWHLAWYVNDGAEKYVRAAKPILYQAQGGNYRLTTYERKRILLNNIYGVDIDPQAVEVTKLSLLLKVLEGENSQTLETQLKLFHDRALPDLGNNIKCGNSLIGPDFYNNDLFNQTAPSINVGAGSPRPFAKGANPPHSPFTKGGDRGILTDDERLRINAFDWNTEFKDIMASGGFDAVIGNPPYGYMISSEQQKYFSRNYKHQDYQKDYYLLFLERYEFLLKKYGLLGVIVSNTWLQSVTLKKIRQYLSSHFIWLKILHLTEKAFQAVIDTHVLIFQKNNYEPTQNITIDIDIMKDGKVNIDHTLSFKDIPRNGDPINVIAPAEAQHLFNKICNRSVPLMKICNVYNGVKPFEKGKGNPPQTDSIIKDKPFVKESKAPNKTWSPLLRGSLINRYKNLWDNEYWIQYGPWLAAPRDPSIFTAPVKIMVRQTGDSIIATLIEKGFIARNNLHILLLKDGKYHLNYVLGIMNSRVIDFAYTTINPEKGEALAEVKKHHVEQLPVHSIDLNDTDDKSRHDKMVSLVDQMLSLNKQLPSAKTEHEKTVLQRQIDTTDKQIDELVYELYGITDEERKMIERTK